MVLQQFQPTPLEQRLLRAAVVRDSPVRHQTANSGSSGVTALILSDSAGALEAYHKPLDGVDRTQAARYGHDPHSVLLNEAVAWFLARTLGDPYRDMVPDMVIRSIWPSTPGSTGGYGALSLGVGGETKRREAIADPALCDPAAFFDALIGQQDRHEANYRWQQGQLSLLDNAYAFAAPSPGFLPWASEFVSARHAGGRAALQPSELNALRALRGAPAVWSWVGMMLREEQSQALVARADRMLSTGHLLGILEF